MNNEKYSNKSLEPHRTMHAYSRNDLERLALGACFLASGGGGTLQSARNLLSKFEKGSYYPTDNVEVISVDEVKDDGYAVVVAYIGAPAKINNAFYPEGPVQAALQVQAALKKEGKELKYIVPVETGALGVTVPSLVAAKLGLKVISTDGAGRAVPSLPQLTYAYAKGLSPLPAFVANQKDTATSSASDLCIKVDVDIIPIKGGVTDEFNQSRIVDEFMRPVISESAFGQFGGLALWIMDPAQLQAALPIRNTWLKASFCGALLSFEANSGPLIKYLNNSLHLSARSIFGPGKLSVPDASTQTGKGGFDFGKIQITDNSNAKRVCTVLYQNETLVAYVDEKNALCGAPDSIAYFMEKAVASEQRVFSNEDLLTEDGKLREDIMNRDFSLIGIPGDPVLWNTLGIKDGFKNLITNLGYTGTWQRLPQE